MEWQPKQIAIVQGAASSVIQKLFREFVAHKAPSLRIAGLIEGSSCEAATDGYLISIADGRRFALFQELGSGFVACSLDAASVIEASERVCVDIALGCDLVVLSKFGKLEAENRSGLIPAFVAAMEAGTPILTSVSPKYANAWSAFAAPMFVALQPDIAALNAWWMSTYGIVK